MSDKMKEYIEREAALKWQVPHYSTNGVEIIEGKAIPVEYIENLPAADVIEEQHGQWIGEAVPDFDLCGVKYFYCSKCGWAEQVDYYNYCPNCGAKMDKEVE